MNNNYNTYFINRQNTVLSIEEVVGVMIKDTVSLLASIPENIVDCNMVRILAKLTEILGEISVISEQDSQSFKGH